MKIIRFNENLNDDEPQEGDYVICTTINSTELELKLYIDVNIGQIINISTKLEQKYIVYYDNLPNNLVSYVYNGIKINNISGITFEESEILYWSKDKKDLENILLAKKFNL